MNTRRIVRISLLLGMVCLLAAVSFAAAQQPGPAKEAPAVYSPGESAAITPTHYESEPNNTIATADMFAVPAVMAGTIASPGDVDYFRYYGGDDNLIVEIDAQKDGSPLDSVLCEMVMNDDGDWFASRCNDDSDGLDSMLYTEYDGQYIEVRDLYGDGGADYDYTLLIYPPLLISPAVNGTVMGVAFNKSDILANYRFGSQDKWMLFFDASDVNITQNINGLFISDPLGEQYPFYMTVQANQSLGGGVTATPWDFIGFVPYRLGPSTAGELYLSMDGSDEGLTAAGEKIDAIALGRYWYSISTTGVLKVPLPPSGTYVAQDEDLSDLDDESGWYCCEWFLDGSAIPGLGAEDITAAHVSWDDNNVIYAVIAGSGRVDGLAVNQKDIFVIDPDWNRVLGYFWRGKDHGFNFNIDAIDLSDSW